MEELADDFGLVAKAIELACVSASSRLIAKEDPEVRSGMMRMAERHSHNAAGLLDAWVNYARSGGLAAVRSQDF